MRAMTNDLVVAVRNGNMSAVQAAEAALAENANLRMDYRDAAVEATLQWQNGAAIGPNATEYHARQAAYRAIQAAAQQINEQRAQPPVTDPEVVRCACGHIAARSVVMSTSRGTSCPDCYDRMSD